MLEHSYAVFYLFIFDCYRRELEYQNALKQQIEEKKRQKEEEKRKEEDLKRREYEEYLMAVNPKALEKMKQQQSDPPPKKSLRVNDGDRRQRENEVDYDEPPRNRRQRGGQEERDPPPRSKIKFTCRYVLNFSL
jgi:hypothetical protein